MLQFVKPTWAKVLTAIGLMALTILIVSQCQFGNGTSGICIAGYMLVFGYPLAFFYHLGLPVGDNIDGITAPNILGFCLMAIIDAIFFYVITCFIFLISGKLKK